MDQKAERLSLLLGALPTNEAVTLARKLEIERALGQETLPAETVLAILRPQLRRVRPQRVPTLCRLACAGFEDFLVDRVDEPRLPGLIPRSAVAPWWQALVRMAPREIKDLGEEFTRLTAASDWPALERLSDGVCAAARGWTGAVIAAFESRRLADAVTRKALGDIGLQTDFAEIARVLAIAAPLRKALDAVLAVAARHGQAQGRRLLDFTGDVVTAAKQQYLRFAEIAGIDSRYFALGLMNRLERPWYVLRPGRATVEELGIEIDNRAAKLYDELAQRPANQAAAAQLAAIIKVAEVLYDDGRAAVMTRRLVNMQRAAAPA